MERTKIERLNELAHKAKTEGLTDKEVVEREVLRREYIAAFKKNMQATLESVRIEEADGSLTPLKKRTGGAKHHHHDENCTCGCHHHQENEIPEQ